MTFVRLDFSFSNFITNKIAQKNKSVHERKNTYLRKLGFSKLSILESLYGKSCRNAALCTTVALQMADVLYNQCKDKKESC